LERIATVPLGTEPILRLQLAKVIVPTEISTLLQERSRIVEFRVLKNSENSTGSLVSRFEKVVAGLSNQAEPRIVATPSTISI
jgi:hypothetical protein